MKCPKCQFENREGVKFCIECGNRLETACSNCNHLNPPESKFCEECGSTLSHASAKTSAALSFDDKLEKIQKYIPKGLTEKILSQRNKIEGERKQVTVMFCDIVGFTQLSEMLGAEETYSVMDQVYETLIHIVQEHQGTVNEFTGDGIMALFGAPIALEDAPQRAIRSAHAIHRKITDFSDEITLHKNDMPPFRMRIGIHTGPVVVGALGNDLRVEFKAVGDTVNLASRMEGLAEPGTTYVTEDTFKLTKGLFNFEEGGEKEVKGKKEPVHIYKLLSAKTEEVYRPRLGLERMIYSEMVGRNQELDRLQLQMMKVINGEGSIVNVIGEAGIGKSRLIAELKNCEVMKKVTLLEGKAISIGRNLSFHLIITLLKEWAQIKESDSGSAALSKLETAVRRVDPEGMHEVLPFVATLMGMKLRGKYADRIKGIEGENLEKLILKNVRDFLIKASDMNPLVIVAEDVHWADTSSIELIESLFLLSKTQKILFINVFRPGYKETSDKIVESLLERLSAYYVEIVLQPLNERMSETLVNNMLNIKGLPPIFINKVVERAGGNPFFIEEVVRSLIDEGAVVAKDGAFEVTKKIDAMVIPYTINDVLMARIDRLEEETRNLVKIASVIGRNFFHRILAEVARTVEGIDDRLSYLKEIQLIRERRRMEEVEYLFKHALAQEAAYDSILLQKRKDLHLKIADSIERIFNERLHEFYGMLALHYSRGENLDKSEEYMIKAGDAAINSAASSEALYYFQEALKIYTRKYGDTADPGKVAIFEKNIALSLHHSGNFMEAIEYFDRVLLYYGVKNPKNSILRLIKFLFCFLDFLISLYIPSLKWREVATQKDMEVVDLFAKKISELTQINPKRMFVESLFFVSSFNKFDLATLDWGVGMYSGISLIFSFTGISFGLSKRILDICEGKVRKTDVRSAIYYEMSLIGHNYYAGEWSEAKDFDDNLANKSLRIGEIQIVVFCMVIYGLQKLDQGYYNQASRMSEKLSMIAEEFENQDAQIQKYELNTKLLVKYGKYREALAEIEEAILYGNKLGLKQFVSFFYVQKTQLHIMLREIDEAEISLEYAKENLSEIDTTPTYSVPFIVATLNLHLYRLEKSKNSINSRELTEIRNRALKTGKKALKISKKRAAYRTEVLRLMGRYYWLIDRQKKALEWWSRSLLEGERLGARLELSRTFMELGKRLLEPESKYKDLKGKKADEYLSKAKTMFQEMDLQWDLDELAKLN